MSAFPINVFEEDVLSLDEAAKVISAITKRKRNVPLIRRWITRGVDGVRLGSVKIGREWFTSKQALLRFLNRTESAEFVEAMIGGYGPHELDEAR
jgi:hypothetical protein